MNALTLITGGTTKLSETEAMILAEMQEDDNAFNLQLSKAKIAPGGIGQFMLGDETIKTFVAVVAISQIVRGYWPESGTGKPPICSSPNGNTGYFDPNIEDERFKAATSARHPHPAILQLTNNQPLQGTYDCFTCPMNMWGSEHQRRGGNGGKGKGCKEMRRLLMLVKGYSLPIIMALPPTSIGAWDDYCSSLQNKSSSYFANWTKFTLSTAKARTGEDYNTVQVSMDGKIEDKNTLKAVIDIRKQYKETVVTMPVTSDDYDVPADTRTVDPDTGEVIDTTPPF